ncbi:hypothetical protein L9F63_008065, partial [Diploptera punctata]
SIETLVNFYIPILADPLPLETEICTPFAATHASHHFKKLLLTHAFCSADSSNTKIFFPCVTI